MSRLAYTTTVVNTGFGIGLAEENEPGYWPCRQYGVFDNIEAARDLAARLNQARGLTGEAAAKIVASSMFAQNKGKRVTK